MKKILSFLMVALFSTAMFAEEHTYTVVGASTVLFGETWNPAYAANDMTLVDGVYTITFENKILPAGDIEYKIARDHDWAVAYPQTGNASFNIPETGEYDVTFTLDLLKETPYSVEATKKGEAEVDDVAQLAGGFNSWTPADMILSGDKSKASITINLAKGDYEFKVVINDAWLSDGHAFTRNDSILEGLEGNITTNLSINADVKGEYTFTWTFATKTLVITYPKLPKFYITGSESLVGKKLAWNDDAIMVMEDSYTFENLAAGKYQLKVTEDGTWDTAKGINVMSEVAAGLYCDQDNNICFILDAVSNVKVTYKKGESTEFTLEGAFVAPEIKLIGINGWAEATDAIVLQEAEDHKSASKTVELDADCSFKVIRAGEWLGKENEGEGNYRIHREKKWVDALQRDGEAEAEKQKAISLQPDVKGEYTFTYDFALGKLTVSFPDPVLANGYYLIGVINGAASTWNYASLKAGHLFEINTEAEVEEYKLDVTLAKGDELQIVRCDYDELGAWYPGGESNNFVVDANHAGDKTIYFRPAGNSEWESFHTGGFFYIAPNTATGVDNTEATVKAVKSLKNGMLIIEKNGVRFNAQGQMVR